MGAWLTCLFANTLTTSAKPQTTRSVSETMSWSSGQFHILQLPYSPPSPLTPTPLHAYSDPRTSFYAPGTTQLLSTLRQHHRRTIPYLTSLRPPHHPKPHPHRIHSKKQVIVGLCIDEVKAASSQSKLVEKMNGEVMLNIDVSLGSCHKATSVFASAVNVHQGNFKLPSHTKYVIHFLEILVGEYLPSQPTPTP